MNMVGFRWNIRRLTSIANSLGWLRMRLLPKPPPTGFFGGHARGNRRHTTPRCSQPGQRRRIRDTNLATNFRIARPGRDRLLMPRGPMAIPRLGSRSPNRWAPLKHTRGLCGQESRLAAMVRMSGESSTSVNRRLPDRVAKRHQTALAARLASRRWLPGPLSQPRLTASRLGLTLCPPETMRSRRSTPARPIVVGQKLKTPTLVFCGRRPNRRPELLRIAGGRESSKASARPLPPSVPLSSRRAYRWRPGWP